MAEPGHAAGAGHILPAQTHEIDRLHFVRGDVGQQGQKLVRGQAGHQSPQIGHGHLAGRGIRIFAAGQVDRLQVIAPLVADQIPPQHLAAPKRAVRPVAQIVKTETDGRAGAVVVGQTGGNVGVVMLHPHHRLALDLGPIFGQHAADGLGVQVADRHLGANLEDPFVI